MIVVRVFMIYAQVKLTLDRIVIICAGIEDDEGTDYGERDGRGAFSRICSELVDSKSAVLLVCQDGPIKGEGCTYQCDCSVNQKFRRELTLVTGVPATQLAVLANSCVSACIGADNEYFYFTDVLTEDDVREEQKEALKREEACEKIRKISLSDGVLRNIKKRVWRPNGTLVAQMVRDASASRM